MSLAEHVQVRFRPFLDGFRAVTRLGSHIQPSITKPPSQLRSRRRRGLFPNEAEKKDSVNLTLSGDALCLSWWLLQKAHEQLCTPCILAVVGLRPALRRRSSHMKDPCCCRELDVAQNSVGRSALGEVTVSGLVVLPRRASLSLQLKLLKGVARKQLLVFCAHLASSGSSTVQDTRL